MYIESTLIIWGNPEFIPGNYMFSFFKFYAVILTGFLESFPLISNFITCKYTY